MSVKTYSRVRCVIQSVYDKLLEVNSMFGGTSPHSRTTGGLYPDFLAHPRIPRGTPIVLGTPSHVGVGGVPPPNPPLVRRPRTEGGTSDGPHAEVVRVILYLTTSYIWDMTTYKEKLKAKRWRARLLAGKCSCKTCYNSIFNNYIARNQEARLIYDIVLAEKWLPPKTFRQPIHHG